jgi:DNA-binding helix-hairpin-helix protein with protein kinase domain
MRVEAAEQNWAAAAALHSAEYDRKKADLQVLRDRHHQLAKEYTTERQRLQANAREMQMKAFLQQRFINDHHIPGIGPTRKAALTSFGIETADDIERTRVEQVPGFGQKLTDRLIDWRRTMERRFVFHPSAGIPPQVQQALDSRYAQERQQIETKLLAGEQKLKSLSLCAEGELRQLYEHIRTCVRQLAQANADVAAIPSGF